MTIDLIQTEFDSDANSQGELLTDYSANALRQILR